MIHKNMTNSNIPHTENTLDPQNSKSKSTKNLKAKATIKLIIYGLLACFIIFILIENKHLSVSSYTYSSPKLDRSFEGFKILQISDLHNANFGKNNSKLTDKIKDLNPDIIVITGDLVDSNHTNIERVLNFAGNITEICPVYFVTGNHEMWLTKEDSDRLITGLKECGVKVLNNECTEIQKDDSSFTLCGLSDASLQDETLKSLLESTPDSFNVVLAHEPLYLNNYAGAGADLVLSGHAHGGQIVLPFIGGVVAPDQGFNPEYYKGEYTSGNTLMIVSAGLGNSVIPVRVFDNPEIVCVELKAE